MDSKDLERGGDENDVEWARGGTQELSKLAEWTASRISRAPVENDGHPSKRPEGGTRTIYSFLHYKG